MTDVIIYFALAIAATFAAVYLKQIRPDFALCITLAAVALLLSGAIPRIGVLVSDIRTFSSLGGIPDGYITSILKIIGITYIAEFSADICMDAGEKAIASHVETIGKITVAFIALPIIEDVFSLIINLLE